MDLTTEILLKLPTHRERKQSSIAKDKDFRKLIERIEKTLAKIEFLIETYEVSNTELNKVKKGLDGIKTRIEEIVDNITSGQTRKQQILV